MSKMKKHEIEAAISQGIKNMNLSHRKELLPFIFEDLGISEYYEAFDAHDDNFYKLGAPIETYHNKFHMQAVALNCYEAMHSTLTEFDKSDKQALMIAALYHDFKHLRIAAHDYLNIGMALKSLDEVHSGIKHKVGSKVYNKISKLIQHTEYPYTVPSSNIQDPLSHILRDSDLMMVYEKDEDAIKLLQGLFTELNLKNQYNGHSEITFAEFVSGNTKFLQKVQWISRWARNKAFMLNFPKRVKDMQAILNERIVVVA